MFERNEERTMDSIHWSVNKNVDNLKDYPQIREAARLLQSNQVLAFPTETVYGLGANALSDDAVAKIYEAKGRPSDNPLIVHIAELHQLEELVDSIPAHAHLLMKEFWPGPLTLIFPKKAGVVSEKVTAGLDTIAVRMPDHPVALALISAARLPIAAPSANRSGKPSPTTALHVATDLDGRIAGILDGGPTGVGLESTVVDCTGEVPIILRPGGISKEEIERVIGNVLAGSPSPNEVAVPKSPGMKYKHYAPVAPLYLLDGEPTWIQSMIDQKRRDGLKVGIMSTTENAHYYNADLVLECGSRMDLQSVAHYLYEVLRKFDEVPLDCIFSEVFPDSGIGAAIMNRLDKAAGHQWIRQTD